MDYLEEGRRIWRDCVPRSGQADTVEGELLRAVEKLRDEATRNGNGNWDQGFEILLAYLRAKLLDTRLFGETVVAEIDAILDRLNDFRQPCLDDVPYDYLGDRVVDYFKRYGSQPNERNAELLR
jgi:hypothetical protein